MTVYFENFSRLNLPAITINKNNNNFLFIIDTGSDSSILHRGLYYKFGIKNKEVAKGLTIESSGIGGAIEKKGILATTDFKIASHQFKESFVVRDLSTLVKEFKRDYDISISGILGITFLYKYNITLDFKYLNLNINLKDQNDVIFCNKEERII